ncbi:hypothetical protein J2X69_002637 [Algoriphagus sp. 4150]|uniref:hypothetical protein n=1 Tax=Algoriphagus sp. 4150 TaxID=2817756 RepID=UPI002859E3EA|nr:hypothetical protein [Algoriphagus sp. 4150]MDR7130289.1 hypothetical protein [Algoriphagus sp. 4150]
MLYFIFSRRNSCRFHDFDKGKKYREYIFPADYYGFVLDKRINSVLLNENQVIKIEKILIEQYYNVLKNDARVSKEIKLKNNVEKQIIKYDRQYLGFLCENGDLCAKILLANRSGKGKKYFNCFDKVMAFGFGEFYEKN